MGVWDKLKSIFGGAPPAPKRPSTAERRALQFKTPSAPLAAAPVSKPRRTAKPRMPGLTETRIVNTAFGYGQLVEDGHQTRLRIKTVPADFIGGVVVENNERVGLVPFLEGEVIEGAYLFDPAKIEIEQTHIMGVGGGPAHTEKKAFLLPVLASSPYFFLSPDHKKEIVRIIAFVKDTAGETIREPRMQDITVEVVEKMRVADVVWKEEGTKFVLPKFVDLIESVKFQEGYEYLMQITLKGNIVYLLSVGKHIASVFDLGPTFMNINAARAVRLAYDGNQNTWLAPFGKRA
ncbi:MAG: hypothetical protein HY897_01990 [Deltaproteobacteria bacterium]|nr:hypothetical protein [Deltaproteobacteria bacterium]